MVCDSTEAGRAAAMQIAPNVPVVASLDEVTTGAVVIATPAATHYEIARHALETGRDVFVEKPLALTYAQGARLVQIAREQRRILMVGHVLEYHPAVVRLIEMVRNGDLASSTTSTPID
jgi:Predicted dehydrogenases and related proteins